MLQVRLEYKSWPFCPLTLRLSLGDEGIRGNRDQRGYIVGAPGADVRLCREPVQGGSSCLAWGGGCGWGVLGSWPHWVD